jgi:LmbE family N-acetylglucosaminyl deacetylase
VRLLRLLRVPSLDGIRTTVASVRAGDALRHMASLPYADLDAITGGGTALVLAPHPDDESLGCGGLIAEACARGRPPVVAVLTDGTMSHPSSPSHPPARLKALREEETRAAVDALGLPPGRLHFLGLPDSRTPADGPGFAAAVDQVAELLREQGCGCILATWEHDPHRDHVAAHAIAREAARRAGVRLVSYPVWGWTLPARHRLPGGPAAGGARLDVARHLPAKRQAIAAHASQHPGLIADDPKGFSLTPEMLAFHDRPFEVFLFGQDAPPPAAAAPGSAG